MEEIKETSKIAMNKELELQLIQKSIDGDNDAFCELLNYEVKRFEAFKNYYAQLSSDDFNDCWQKASLKAFLNLKQFNLKSSFHTWFYIILKNEVLYFFNTSNKLNSKTTSLSNFYSDVIDLHSIEENTPLTHLINKENADGYNKLLNSCFSNINESDKQILEMALLQDMSYKEIANELKLSPNTVGTRLFYAKKYAKREIIKHANIRQYSEL